MLRTGVTLQLFVEHRVVQLIDSATSTLYVLCSFHERLRRSKYSLGIRVSQISVMFLNIDTSAFISTSFPCKGEGHGNEVAFIKRNVQRSAKISVVVKNVETKEKLQVVAFNIREF